MSVLSFRTPAEARAVLPNLLGILAELHLKERGEYRCLIDGQKVTIRLKGGVR